MVYWETLGPGILGVVTSAYPSHLNSIANQVQPLNLTKVTFPLNLTK